VNETVAKLAGLSLLLIAVWIAVYWITPAEPRVTFADLEAPGLPTPSTEKREPAGLPKGPVAPPRRETPVEPPVVEPEKKPDPKPEPKKPEVAVVPPEFFEHVVQKNETFDAIAKKYFGPKATGAIIARANPFVDPLRLKPGRTIRVPKDPKNIQGIPVAPSPTPKQSTKRQTYTVVAGDSLSRIASKVYGDSTKAALIFDANRDQLADVDSLSIGQVLVIPEYKPE
jgi:nucleoid-associated protein YgaU